MSRCIAIMGCGWLGLPLARAFLKRDFLVHGSTTTQEKITPLLNAGIKPFKLVLGEMGIEGPVAEFLKNVEILVIAVPPGLRKANGENYFKKMDQMGKAIKGAGIKKILFVSSISVYGRAGGKITEQTPARPDNESGRQVLASERIFSNDPGLQTIIVRFGGLIGPDRHPVNRLSGKKGLENGQDRINLIHLQDCIQLIETVICAGHWNEIFNGVYPAHPEKHIYYTREARKRQLKPPAYSVVEGQKEGKYVISGNYLTKNYSFFTSIFL